MYIECPIILSSIYSQFIVDDIEENEKVGDIFFFHTHTTLLYILFARRFLRFFGARLNVFPADK